jgi:hypothetical protein
MLAAREEQAYNRGIDERNFEYQQGRDEVADKQWQQSFDYNKYLDELEQANFDKQFEYRQGRDTVADEQWNKQFASQEEQRAEDNAYRDKTFEYQQGRDEVYDSQWKAELDRMLANDEISQQQWQAEMDRALANDATANEQWQAGMDWQAEEFDKLYGEGGYYTTEAQKDREHQASENQLNREHDASESKLNREHQSNENKLNREHDASESKLNREHDSSENKLNREHQISENQLNRQHDEKMQNDTQTHQSEMATQEHNWQAEEWDKMYGENGYMTKKDKQDQENWQAQFDREGDWYDDAQEAAKSTTKYKGEGDFKGQEVPKQLAGVEGLTTTNPGLFDENGYFKEAAIVNVDYYAEGGYNSPDLQDVITYNVGGKEVQLRRGFSPYTNTKNPDAAKGTFNGYQPNNIGGDPLTETNEEYCVNGQWVPIYTTSDGKEWVYDAANNKYFNPKNAEKSSGGGGGGSGMQVGHAIK